MSVLPRPAIDAAISISALALVLRALGEKCAVVADDEEVDAGRVGEFIEDASVDVDADTDAEGVEDSVMLLSINEIAEDDVVGLDSASVFKDSGEGA